MPIYEYTCAACDTRFSRFFRSQHAASSGSACSHCGAEGAKRAISAFLVHQTLKTQIDNIDPAFEKQIDAAMQPHLASDPLNRIDLSFGGSKG